MSKTMQSAFNNLVRTVPEGCGLQAAGYRNFRYPITPILSSARGVALALIAFVWISAGANVFADNVYWNFQTDTPTSGVPSGLTFSAVSQGNNNGTTTLLTASSVSSTYTGFSAANNAGAAARIGALNTAASGSAYFEFTITPNAGFSFNISAISFGSRETSTGPKNYTIRSSVDGYATDLATGSLSATSAWALRSNSGLNINGSSATTYRIYGYNGAGSASANTANWRIDDLTVTVIASGGSSSPTITLNPTSLSGLTTTTGANSSAASYTVTGTNLGATNVTVTPNSSLIEISTNASTGFATNALTLTQTGGVVSNTVYVRIANVATATNFSTTIANVSGSVSTNLTVSGSVTAAGTPSVAVSPTSATGLTNYVGQPSATTNYTVTGTNLVSNLVVTASTNVIEVSTNSSTGFTNSFSLAPAGDGTLSNTVYVRISAAASAGAVNGSVSNVSGSASNNFTVSGTVTQPALTLVLNPTSVAENAGAGASTGTVGIPFSLTNDLTISLVSSNTAAATVPSTVTITNGQTSATFAIAAVANTNSYVANTAVITASAANYSSANATLTVSNVDAPMPTYISLTNTNANSYTQDFNSLGTNSYAGAIPGGSNGAIANLGPSTGLNSINGWYAKQIAGSTTTAASLAADTGSGNGGNLYNYGTSGDANRALGCLASGGRTMAFGALVKNDTGGVLNGVRLTFKGEFWRSSTSVTNKLTFGYGLVDGTVVTTDNFLSAPANGLSALNVVGPAPVTSNGLLVGTNSTNQSTFTDVYVGAAIQPGAVLFIRWSDVDDSGNDAGLAIDDLFITASTGPLPADGVGSLSMANPDSAYNSLPVWPRGATNQVLRLSVKGTVTSGTINSAEITVPPAFTSGLTTSQITVEGSGRGTPVVGLVSNVLTVSGLQADVINPATIVLSNVTIPQTQGNISNDGNYVFAAKTQTGEGVLQTVGNSPVAYVTIPLANLGDVDTNGVPLDSNKMVAVSGTCTEENFNSSASTSAYIQDGQPDGTNKVGINVYSTLRNLFARSNSYVVLGSVLNYNGLTEVVVTNSTSVISFGAASYQPTPVTLTIGQLTAAHEAYEGSLVRVAGLSKATNGGAWALNSTTNSNNTVTYTGANVILQAGGTNLTARLNVGSTALTEPIYPAAITGIYGQFVAAAPYTGGGQIQPRDQADIEDAPGFRLELGNTQINEGGSFTSTTLTISRTGGSVGSVSGVLSAGTLGKIQVLEGGVAQQLPYSFTLADGIDSTTLTIEAIDNLVYGGDVNVELTVTDPAISNPLSPGSATVTILENETAPAPDTTKPVITLIGANPLLIANGGTYADPGATVTDNVDADRTINGTGTVNTAVAGDYTITYNAIDAAGNAAIAVTRTVRVAGPLGTTYSSWLGVGAPSDAAFWDYVYGATAPGALTSSLKPTSAITGGNLVLTYYVRQNTLGLTVTAKTSVDLGAGAGGWSTDGVTDVAVGAPATVNGVSVQQRTASVPVSGAKKFLKLEGVQAQ